MRTRIFTKIGDLLGSVLWLGTVFAIRVTDGAGKVKWGKVPAGFVRECERLCKENNIKKATIKGVRRGRRIRLEFSYHIHKRQRQKFRNAWSFFS